MNKPDKTLVILSPGFPASESDSTCLPLQQNLVKTLQQLYPGWQFVVIAMQYPYTQKNYAWHDIPVYPFNGRNKGGIPRLLLRNKVHRFLRQMNQRQPIKGILSFWYGECARAGKKFADEMNIPHFNWLLGQDAKKNNTYPGKLSLPAGQLLALSDFIQDEFERNHGPRPAHVIDPGIDITQFGKSSGIKDIDLLAAGSLVPLKQFDVFIEIVAALKKQIPGIQAVLIGDGPGKEFLLELIRTKELQSSVTLAGELPYDQVLAMMQRSKVFLHPSSYEAFGMVCAEALYAGARVISFVQPMKQPVKNWHHVKDKQEMISKTWNILREPATIHPPVLYKSIEETARNIMALFPE